MSSRGSDRSVCLIADSVAELVRELAPILTGAISGNERCACVFVDGFGEELRNRLAASDPLLASAMAVGTLTFSDVDGLNRLISENPGSLSESLRALTTQLDLGNNDWTLLLAVPHQAAPQTSEPRDLAELIGFQSHLSSPIFCHDRSKSTPERLAAALETHPFILFNSKVIPNPYHRLAFETAGADAAHSRVDQMISRLQDISSTTDIQPLSIDGRRELTSTTLFLANLARSGGSIVCIDYDGTILDINSIAEASVGIPRAAQLGKNVWELFPQAVGSETFQQIQRLRVEKQLTQFETFSSVLGRWIEVTLAPADDRIWLSVRDISKRKEVEQTLNVRVRQQAAVAKLGQDALSSSDLQDLMNQLVTTVQQTLDVDYVKILELLPDQSGLRLIAGVGWQPGLVGTAIVDSGPNSQSGYTLNAQGPVIVDDLPKETRFQGPELLLAHNVVSGISVVISGGEKPFGVLGAHTTRHVRFTQDDVNFVQSVSNILAAAIDHARSQQIQRHYAAIVESSVDAIVGASLDGTITGWNPAAERTFGYTADEIIGKPATLLYPEKFVDEPGRLLDEIRAGRRIEWHESVQRTKDGRLIDVLVSMSPIRDETGHITGASKIAVDITARKQAERERVASESRLQLALEAGKMGTWDWNLGTETVTWSANMEEIHGLNPGSFGGTFEDFRRSIHPDDQDRVMSAVRETLTDGKDYYVEYRNMRPDGSHQWLEARGRIVSGGRGRPDHLTGVCTDVTEQVESRVQIARFAAATVAERDRLQQIVDVIPEGILISDPDGQIILSNQAARDIWGRSDSGADWRAYGTAGIETSNGEPLSVEQLPAYRAVLQGERVIGEQLTVRNAITGERVPLLVNSAPLRNENGDITGAVTTFQDITVFKEFETQKDEFLQTLSHDLKNPLTSVKGNAQFLRRRSQKYGEDLQPVIDRIENSAIQAVELIDELLDLTRLQMGRPVELVRSRTDLVHLIAEVAEQQSSTSQFHNITVETGQQAVIAHVDEVRVARVISNLLNNAIKYSPENSEIVVTVRTLDGEPGWAEIRVIDHGIGIPESDLPRLFERFRRGSNVEGQIRGSGLGLSSSIQIVEQHGGNILVTSTEGEGSTFTVLLPLHSS